MVQRTPFAKDYYHPSHLGSYNVDATDSLLKQLGVESFHGFHPFTFCSAISITKVAFT